MDYSWLALSWVVYFILHSIFALLPVKTYFYSIGMKPQSYRLIYVIIATFLLIAILAFSSMIDSGFLFYPNNILKLIGLLLAGWGVVIAKVAFKSYDTKAFLGLGSLNPEDEFRTDGLLKKVRHPLYSGSILLITGYFLFSPKISVLISVSMMIIYFLVGIQFEEKKLEKAFGEKYLEYKKKTPMLIPRFWK
ncbi:MAG: isoprenylcysteine carboxylmethyltransferase family protein, partial [Cyclobacteriaceae bacterium]|nr:isoprenylcysteine carboxylmethyltransferase family protein [Cyclobacteriaceae bacterium]MCK5371629.1 isoprenylcysteine carboxylmethyltransferase family protein [Cyclobacteriaceae bacterium]MCK5468946.1 isoprenylcysteine carboxylmethyltransferase family protein [Cyclobacteriaceae bacterium]MCK5700238.1 isoprenylcysteine carboxylmethyltransferase family protein [Cyclobacteriaceae bacterium]